MKLKHMTEFAPVLLGALIKERNRGPKYWQARDGTTYGSGLCEQARQRLMHWPSMNRALAQLFPTALGVLSESGDVFVLPFKGQISTFDACRSYDALASLECKMTAAQLDRYLQVFRDHGVTLIEQFMFLSAEVRVAGMLYSRGLWPCLREDWDYRSDQPLVVHQLESYNIQFDTALPQAFYDRVHSTATTHPWLLFVWAYPEGMLSGLPCPTGAEGVAWAKANRCPYYDPETHQIVKASHG